MKTACFVGAALLAASVMVGSGEGAMPIDVPQLVYDTEAATLEAGQPIGGAVTDADKAAPRRYGKGPTQGGGRRGGCGCG